MSSLPPSRLERTRKAVSTMVVLILIIFAVVAAAGVVGYYYTKTKSTSTNTTSTSSSAYSGPAESLTAGGSSFVNPVMQEWIFGFTNLTKGAVSINYATVGSGAGQQGLIQNIFAYAGSDAPLNFTYLDDLKGQQVLTIPDTLGAVVVFYNIPTVGNVTLKMTGPILADIWDENLTMWNDPRLVALNPGIALPDQQILPVHRSDGSGTTYAFTSYLSDVDPTWNSTIGVGLSVNWPSNELSNKGSSGIATTVYETPYSIGYVDQYYAEQNKLSFAAIQNSAGNFILPNITTITDAANAFQTQLSSNPIFTIVNAPGADSYPLSTFSYLMAYAAQSNYGVGYAVASFFSYVVNQGQRFGPGLDFPELPASMVTIDNKLIDEMTYNGQALI
ncbi:MAG TPA: phosphate ABC transporter substrate-binding protein PstS [Nitrososphaerales archaeon]|nr:phosphate ABC transporter substrate-binding protein PstS [Nitrososphaerales archaeon]